MTLLTSLTDYKIQPILDETFAAVYSPSKNVRIDESIIPFQGRVIFLQYIQGKRHTFGIKVYKLGCSGGNTCKFIVYARQQRYKTCQSSRQAVLDLVTILERRRDSHSRQLLHLYCAC
ncbi:unnamed protein product [Haemonchus placei]|uniref:DDE_Tnp_1_7 domain-containing protein n=1 Tax=Haemonchus placei TaxID=6290 RepID=A0A0N4WHI9_HAEPC|nr:unnamed protein product [Haemonchus placei]